MKPSLITSRSVTAFHEAGHAVIGSLLGRGVASVTIVSHGDAEGCCSFTESDLLREQLDGGKPFPNKVESATDFEELARWERHQAMAAGRARKMMAAAVIYSLAGPLAVTYTGRTTRESGIGTILKTRRIEKPLWTFSFGLPSIRTWSLGSTKMQQPPLNDRYAHSRSAPSAWSRWRSAGSAVMAARD
ncbi:MAG: hypothetical protein ABIU86_11125 [Gemmatimonadaceae bacterium]